MRPVRIMSWYPKFNGRHFWLAIQPYPQNDWAGWQFRVNYDIFAQAPYRLRQTTPRDQVRVRVISRDN